MRTVAYIRISTGSQGLDSQRLAILDYAHQYGLTVQTFVEAQVWPCTCTLRINPTRSSSRPLKEQKGLVERALTASQRPSHPS
jgi:hypothetical protein